MTFAKLDPNSDTPKSATFGDIYFSPSDGVGESKYHFLNGNDLGNRFEALFNSAQLGTFTIVETGFGTGLNFLLTANLWQNYQENSNNKSTLHFISVEKYPIERETLAQIYQTHGWKNLLTEQMMPQYPDKSDTGQYNFQFAEKYNTIHLTLLIGDAVEQLSTYPFCADAWFLDGFAPSKNPEMWQPKLFDIMAEKRKAYTTFATFTAASAVKKELESAGFQVQKTRGFGRKRERLIGKLNHHN